MLHPCEETGELIDPQADAFFSEAALDSLEMFVETGLKMARDQSPEWQQRVGVHDGVPWCMTTSRSDVLAFLSRLAQAVEIARDQNAGVLFLGD